LGSSLRYNPDRKTKLQVKIARIFIATKCAVLLLVASVLSMRGSEGQASTPERLFLRAISTRSTARYYVVIKVQLNDSLFEERCVPADQLIEALLIENSAILGKSWDAALKVAIQAASTRSFRSTKAASMDAVKVSYTMGDLERIRRKLSSLSLQEICSSVSNPVYRRSPEEVDRFWELQSAYAHVCISLGLEAIGDCDSGYLIVNSIN
jgi:hypothetical protein